MTEKDNQCPYGAADCPKVSALEQQLKGLDTKLDVVLALMCAMLGVFAVVGIFIV